ncbi:hypothetical protein [Photorhabdus viridis]|uniref:hypothetical protein n=1 Tax=Photorhabdus viridis TaxID=3163327 RepID=UPI00330754FD
MFEVSRGELEGILHNNRCMKKTLLQQDYPVESSEVFSGHNYVSWCETLYHGTQLLVAKW